MEHVKQGVITPTYATVSPSKFVPTGLSGGADEYEYVNNNTFFEFSGYDYMLKPAVICQY